MFQPRILTEFDQNGNNTFPISDVAPYPVFSAAFESHFRNRIIFTSPVTTLTQSTVGLCRTTRSAPSTSSLLLLLCLRDPSSTHQPDPSFLTFHSAAFQVPPSLLPLPPKKYSVTFYFSLDRISSSLHAQHDQARLAIAGSYHSPVPSFLCPIM